MVKNSTGQNAGKVGVLQAIHKKKKKNISILKKKYIFLDIYICNIYIMCIYIAKRYVKLGFGKRNNTQA